MCNCGASNYEALQLSFKQRFSKGLAFDAFYTFGKTLSYGLANDSNNIANNDCRTSTTCGVPIGPVDGDIRHLFVTDYSWQIPAGGARNSNLRNAILGAGAWMES